MTRDLDWLKRPIAHRGLHDESKGVVENSASAIEAAIAKKNPIAMDCKKAPVAPATANAGAAIKNRIASA